MYPYHPALAVGVSLAIDLKLGSELLPVMCHTLGTFIGPGSAEVVARPGA